MSEEARAAENGDHPAVVIFVLMLISMFSWLDRSALPLLVEPIKSDLGLSDVQVSVVLSLAFSLAFSVMIVPAAVLVDRIGRRLILIMACILWSMLLLACGLASSYLQLVAMRAALGAVEAFIPPVLFALIGARITPNRHGVAFALVGIGPFIGSALALVGGGSLLAMHERAVFSTVPFLGALHSWQLLFVIGGALMLPFSALPLVLKPDPKVPRFEALKRDPLGLMAALKHVTRHGLFYMLLLIYAACLTLVIYGASSWMPALIARKFPISLEEIGHVLGLQGLVFGVAGLLLAGLCLDVLTKRGLRVQTIAALFMVAFTCVNIATVLSDDIEIVWVLCAVSGVFSGLLYPITLTLLARITPFDMLGRISVLYSIPQTLIGAALGPTIVAILAEDVFGGALGLVPAIGVFSFLFGTVAAAVMMVHGRFERARGPSEDPSSDAKHAAVSELQSGKLR